MTLPQGMLRVVFEPFNHRGSKHEVEFALVLIQFDRHPRGGLNDGFDPLAAFLIGAVQLLQFLLKKLAISDNDTQPVQERMRENALWYILILFDPIHSNVTAFSVRLLLPLSGISAQPTSLIGKSAF
jgi:hypothetical protein